MKMAALSSRTATPVPTVKYYIREGLVPPGERTAVNQAEYGPRHVRRLELIRALREAGGLSIDAIRRVLAAVEAGGEDARRSVGIAMDALSPPLDVPPEEAAVYEHEVERVGQLLDEVGWDVPAGSTARADLVRALVTLRRHRGRGAPRAWLAGYAAVAGRLAEMEIPDRWDPGRDPEESLEYAVLGTVLYEPVLLALRRLAHVDRSRRLTGAEREADR